MVTQGRRVTKDGFVSYNGNEYSVPEGLVRGAVHPRATLEELHLIQAGQLVARHPVLEGRGHRRIVPGQRRHKKVADSPTQQYLPGSHQNIIEVRRRPLEVYERVLS